MKIKRDSKNIFEFGPTRFPGYEVAVVTFAASFMLDFKGAEGGSVIQYTYAAISILSGLSAVVLGGGAKDWRVARFSILTIAVIALGTISAVVFGAPIERWLRVVLPFIVFVLGFWIGADVASTRGAFERLVKYLFAFAIISQIFRLWYAQNVGGISIDDARYQILSPVVQFPIAYGFARLFFGRTLPIVASIGMVFSASMILLSVTRTYLISLIVLLGYCAWLFYKIKDRLELKRRSLVLRHPIFTTIFALLALAFVIQIAVLYRPEVYSSWKSRLFEARVKETGLDYTFLTRAAEISGIFQSLKEEPISFLIGRGFGTTYNYDLSFADDLRDIAPHIMELFVPTWNASHNVFAYALFFGGLFGLYWQFAMFWQLVYCALISYRCMHREDDRNTYVFIVAAFCIMAMAQSFTSNPFGERLSAVYLGLCAGMTVQLVSPRIYRSIWQSGRIVKG